MSQAWESFSLDVIVAIPSLHYERNVAELCQAMGTYEKEERDGGGAKSGFGSGTKSESFNGRRVAAAGEVMRGGIVHR